jgi:DNA-binding NtrC family response regulator
MTVDVRLVAATNRNLEQMVKEGKFREDLFFRLNVVRITTPPLRERADDIPVLLDHFIQVYSKENNYEPVTVEPGAMKHLQAYPWPGNIRELRNFAENAVVLRRGGKLTEFDLEPKFRGEVAPPPSMQTPTPTNPYSVEDNEKRLLKEALMKARGNRTKAATLLGISRRTLHRKIAQWPELDVVDRG